jgi:CheY-like chemotaxis protein
VLDLFRADVAECGARIEENITALVAGAADVERLGAIARDARTIASGGCILGIQPAVRLGRAIEEAAGAGARRAVVVQQAAIDAMLAANTLLARVAAASAHIEGWLTANADAVETAASALAATIDARKRVLVVDDSPTVREIERRMLERVGYAVEVAADGLEAWNAVQARHHDLVVADIDMPRMSGYELVSQMRADSRFSAVPIVLVTMRDSEEERARGLESGATRFMVKRSYSDESLVEVVEELFGA